MQFRFRTYNKATQEYDLVTYFDVEKYEEMFKTLTFMKEHECSYAFNLNDENAVDTLESNSYRIVEVGLCAGKMNGADTLLPHFTVDLEEE